MSLGRGCGRAFGRHAGWAWGVGLGFTFWEENDPERAGLTASEGSGLAFWEEIIPERER